MLYTDIILYSFYPQMEPFYNYYYIDPVVFLLFAATRFFMKRLIVTLKAPIAKSGIAVGVVTKTLMTRVRFFFLNYSYEI